MSTTAVNPGGTIRKRLDQLPRQAQLTHWPVKAQPVTESAAPSPHQPVAGGWSRPRGQWPEFYTVSTSHFYSGFCEVWDCGGADCGGADR